MTATSQQRPRSKSFGDRVRELREQARQQAGLDYQLLRFIIFTLVGIGVLMVFSSSMATSLTEDGGVWNQALRQCVMVFFGLLAFWLGLQVSPHTLRKCVPWIVGLSIILLIAVLIPGVGTGREEVGSQSWIYLGPFSLQPSELARIAVGMFGASVLADKEHKSMKLSDPFMMYSFISAGMFLLIVGQGDMGMALSFAIVVVFTLIFAGVDWRVPATIGVAAVLGLIGIFLKGGFRSNRFHTYFDALLGNISDTQGTGFQSYQGFLSLADGGFWGVGIGQSRAKWFYLPEAKNDFIYAIVGEELGWWGGALVIFLFAALGYVGLRTAMRAQNQFQSLLAASLTIGVVTQAFVNIGYVIGLLPVTGIQLPMISAGGTAAIITIGSMGVLCNVARHEPMQISAMQNFGRPFFDRLFFIGEPQPVSKPKKKQRGRHARPQEPRSRVREEQFGRPVTGSGRRYPRAESRYR